MKLLFSYQGNKVSQVVLLLFFPILSLSQSINPYSKNYTVSDGLPSMECYQVIQDHSGYIWIATDRGVARFDGYDFANFTTADGLTDNVILHLFCDYKNRVWMAGLNGTICYAENGKILPYRFSDSLKKVFPEGGLITSFFCDEDDHLVFGITLLGILVIDAKGNIEIKSDSKNDYQGFLKSKSHIVSGYSSVENIKRIKGTADGREKEISFPITWGNHHAQCAAVLPSGSIVMPAETKLLFIDFNHLPPAIYQCPEQPLFIYPESDSSVWISDFSNGGISRLIWNRARNTVRLTQQYYRDVIVSSMCADSAGGFWFTTLADGLYYIPSFSTKLLSRSNTLLSSKNITGMAQREDGTPLFSTEKEIYTYRNDSVFLLPKQFQSPSEKPIQNILTSGNLLYVVRAGATALIDLRSGILPNKIQYYINDFIADSSGLFITSTGCYWFKNALAALATKEILHAKRCDAILKSGDGKIWIGSVDGLTFLDKDLSPNVINDPLLLGTRVKDMLQLPNGNFIIAGMGRGLIFWDRKNGATLLDHPLNRDLQLTNCIAVDSGGIIWAGTNKGLYRISKKETGKYDVIKIGSSDGIPLTDVRKIYVYEGKIFLLCYEGILIYDPPKEKTILKTVPIYFSNVKSGNEIFSSADMVRIPYDKRNLSVQFKGIDYSQFGKINYRYRLTDADTLWKFTTNTQVDFPGLLAGAYTLQVEAKNSANSWSKPVRLSFFIVPPIYARWWFIALCAMVIVSIVFWVIIRRNSIYLKKTELQFAAQQRMNEMENQAKQAMMNPHFIFNALNSIQQYINDNDRMSANKYLTKFSRLIRLNLDLVNKNLITLEEELEKLKLYLEIEQLRFGEKLHYEFIIEENLEIDIIFIPSMILQPFVENSIWHGLMASSKGGSITLHVTSFNEEKMLRIEILDDGIGINQSKRLNQQKSRKSFGIDLTLDRLKLFGKKYGNDSSARCIDLSEINDSKQGTHVILELPMVFEKN